MDDEHNMQSDGGTNSVSLRVLGSSSAFNLIHSELHSGTYLTQST